MAPMTSPSAPFQTDDQSHQPKRPAAWPLWLRGLWGLAALLAIGYVAAYAVWTFVHVGQSEAAIVISDVGYLPVVLFAALACLRVWRASAADSLTRRAWGFFSLAMAVSFVAESLWLYYDLVHGAPFPSWADVFYLGFYPLAVLGLLSLPYSPVARAERGRLYIDTGITLIVSWMFVWFFVLAPSVADFKFGVESLLAAAYPVADMAILYGLVMLVLHQPHASLRGGFAFLLSAMILFIIADVAFGIQGLSDSYVSGSPLDGFWLISYLLFALAALQQHANLVLHGNRFAVGRDVRPLWLFPYAMLAFGYALTVWAFATSQTLDAASRGLFAGVALVTALVVARHWLDLQENRRLNAELLVRLKELEEAGSALTRAEHLAGIGTLAAGVAHEINNPLSTIIASADMLKRRLSLGRLDAQASLNSLIRIERSAWYCARIAKSLLAYARGVELSLTRPDVKDLFDDALALVLLSPGSGIEVRTVIVPDAPAVICDRDQIVQVLVNLIDNARDAITPPGTITLWAGRSHDGGLIMKVGDTGTGMPPEVAAQAFDPFYTTKPVGKGTGLGLSLCRGIMRAHDGQMEIDSTVGRGTQIILTLPPEPRSRTAPVSA